MKNVIQVAQRWRARGHIWDAVGHWVFLGMKIMEDRKQEKNTGEGGETG